MPRLSNFSFLNELRGRGAHRLREVRFRKNRSTIWSLTQRGSVLNVHEVFQEANSAVLDAFALIVRRRGVVGRAGEAASRLISEWPPLLAAIEHARADYQARRDETACGGSAAATHCCATPEQRQYLRVLFAYFNQTRFEGRLPTDVPVRLSRRMTSALGHMLPGEREGRRYIAEIALNVDLMLPGNGAERVDTLLHEMAHAVDYLETGSTGHGRSWREWAIRVGCTPELLYERPVRRRRRRTDRVTRVPPLPAALVRRVA